MRVPSMKPNVARACILAGYSEAWDMINADSDDILMGDARESHSPKHLRDVESKVEEQASYGEYAQEKVGSCSRMFGHIATYI